MWLLRFLLFKASILSQTNTPKWGEELRCEFILDEDEVGFMRLSTMSTKR